MANIEVRLFQTRRAKNYLTVPVGRSLILEIWTKGTNPRANGTIEFVADTVSLPRNRAKLRAAPEKDVMLAHVQEVQQDPQDTSTIYYRLGPRSIAGIWPLGTDNIHYEGETYQRAEVYNFAD